MFELYREINSIGKGILELGLLDTIFSYGMIFIITYFLNKYTIKYVSKKLGKDTTLLLRIITITYYSIAVYSCGLLIVPLQKIATQLLTSAGVLTVIVGFAAKEALSNVVAGLFITFFKPFSIGDLINLTGQNLTGYVEDISLRHTVIRTYTNTRIIVPNSICNSSILENLSRSNGIKGNYVNVGISYHNDIEQAMEIMGNIIEKHPLFIDTRTAEEKANNAPKVILRCTNFLDSSINIRALFHTNTESAGWHMASDVRIELKKAFDEAGISIPFSQLVVTMNEE